MGKLSSLTPSWKPRANPGPKNQLEAAVRQVLIERPQATVDEAYRRAQTIVHRNFPRHTWKPINKDEWESGAYRFNASRWKP